MHHRRSLLLSGAAAVLGLAAILAACSSHTSQTRGLTASYLSGNLSAAAQEADKQATQRGESRDAVIWRLEQGAVLRAAQQVGQSTRAFDLAEDRIRDFDHEADVKLSRETAATFTNLASLPYKGFAYDRIMMNTYKALNDLTQQQYDKARVELMRALQRQREAVEDNAKRIEKAQEEAAGFKPKNKEGEEVKVAPDKDSEANKQSTVQRAEKDQKFQSQLNSALSAQRDRINSTYSVYVNPFTVYLDGLFFMYRSTGGADFERARKSLERVRGMMADKTFPSADLDALEELKNGQTPGPFTYIIFETGVAPAREEIRLDVPIFLPEVPYVGAAFPKLQFRDNYTESLYVAGANTFDAAHTTLVADMDAIVAQEFDNELPITITRTLISSAVKAAATYGLKEGLGIWGSIGGALYQVSTNQADLRTWTTLPKQFQIARIVTPKDRLITLKPSSSSLTVPVELIPGHINVVYVKSINPGQPLIVSQFTLQ